ncbi:MAG: TrkH family potassium uptake protein [Cyanobacteria bacterium SIG31]|nr:TrkH family potassium uptake protein [Cyanobacteria bacterium SIG31]
MRLSYLAYTFSLAIMYFSFVLLIPIIPALIFRETGAVLPFIIATASALMLSITLKNIIPGAKQIKSVNDIKKSEGLCVVTFSWIFAGLFAMIPYLFFGVSPINALFEATSGITATGATVFTHFDYPKTLFFWRSFSQWLGGMGIIVLFIAILPQFAIAGRQLFFAEAPGPTEDKLTPRIKSTALSLWKIYFGMTLLEIILLKLNGLEWFNAICHAFSSVSGGGFSPHADSVIGYSNSVLWIICFFMFFAGASYNLQYRAWSKFNPLVLFKNEEFRTYFSIVIGLALLLATSLFIHSHYDITNSLTHSFFQICSVISTTGFCSVDFANWDYTSKALLFTAMLAGSCASSAGGGIKIVRWLLVAKIMKSELAKILHPKAVYNIKVGKYSVPKDVLYQTLMFVSFYIAILGISAFTIAIIEQNTIVGISSAVSALGNIGPGLGKIIGPLGSFDGLHEISKCIIILDMYIGRLELIPFLVLFQKSIWTLHK